MVILGIFSFNIVLFEVFFGYYLSAISVKCVKNIVERVTF